MKYLIPISKSAHDTCEAVMLAQGFTPEQIRENAIFKERTVWVLVTKPLFKRIIKCCKENQVTPETIFRDGLINRIH